jgi:hypothetical protein
VKRRWIGLAALIAGCTGAGDSDTDGRPPPSYASDDVLSLADAQVVGTHNSYHVMTTEIDPWAYTHAPLDEQIARIGVRQFELDLFWDAEREAWVVLHVPLVDAGTTCDRLSDCLADLARGSDAVPGHLPIVVLLEVKEGNDDRAPDLLRALEDDLVAVLGTERLVTPGDLGGTAADVASGMASGWPVLEGQRGRFVMVLHARSWIDTARTLAPLPEAYFFDAYGDTEVPWAAVHSVNNPADPRIPALVAAGHLVRTRSDVDSVQALEDDASRAEQAFSSGAHFISTDWPEPHPETGYVVQANPGDPPDARRPARCNTARASDACTADALERALRP